MSPNRNSISQNEYTSFFMNPVLQIEGLSYSTPTGRPLQQDLNISVKSGQLLLISGSNGCGKSTFLKLLMREMPVRVGKLTSSFPREQVEYLPQLENTEVHMPMVLKDVLTLSQSKQFSLQEINQIGLVSEAQLDSAWNTASGGERKRTLLTRALLRNPRLLVLDEPMNHLDEASRRVMSRVLSDFLKAATPKIPRAVVMVCHQGLEKEEEPLFDFVPLDLDKSREMSSFTC